MDGQTLQQLFAGSNPFLAQMGEKAFNLDQEKRQADLATTLGMEQRNQAMHPLEMESKRQAARMSGGQADIYADQLARKIPVEEERKAALQASIAKMDSTSRAQMKEQVVRNMQLAAMMEKNGWQLPQGFSLSPEEMQIFTPKNLKNIIAHGQAFMEMDPDWIAQRKKAQEAERLAQVRGQVQMDVKGTPSAGGGGGATKPSKNPQELMTEYTRLANAAKPGSEEQKHYLALAGAEWQKLQLLAILKAQAPLGGKVDPVGTANDPAGGVVGRPMPQQSYAYRKQSCCCSHTRKPSTTTHC